MVLSEINEQFATALRELSDALTPLGIDWAVAGAVAVNNYRDQIRTTTDLDVMLSLTDQTVEVVRDALHQHGWDQIEVIEKWLVRAQHPVTGRLDVLVTQTEYELGAIARAKIVSIDETHMCKTLAVEDVVILKLMADRYRDNADVQSILVNQPEFDWDYMAKWIEEFDLGERLKRIEDAAIAEGRLKERVSRKSYRPEGH